MRIIQIVSSVEYGDAVGNDVVALKTALENMGYDTQVYAISVSHKWNADVAESIDKLPKLCEDDVVIYHLAIESYLNYELAKYNCRKIIIYHNMTPASFFRGYDNGLADVLENGQKSISFLADKVDYCLTPSEFNKQDLIDHGYAMPIDVLPILVPFDDYKRTPNSHVVEKYSDGRHNIVFTGRVAPNKCHQDIIASFACYKEYYDPEARLFLVGSYDEKDVYYKKLRAYTNWLGVKDVFFTGHIGFDEILAYYQVADVFLCMSEHEGFCVPLVEAMFFGVPIIAYNCAAVPETLGNGGILVDKKDPLEVATLIKRVVADKEMQTRIKENQKKRLNDFQYETVVELFKRYLEKFLASK